MGFLKKFWTKMILESNHAGCCFIKNHDISPKMANMQRRQVFKFPLHIFENAIFEKVTKLLS